jgi:hypothetical protein
MHITPAGLNSLQFFSSYILVVVSAVAGILAIACTAMLAIAVYEGVAFARSLQFPRSLALSRLVPVHRRR